MNSTSSVSRFPCLALFVLLLDYGNAIAMGMMDGQGSGMMGRSFEGDRATQISVSPKRAAALLAYIRNHKLPCSQCHVISDSGAGPAFTMVSAHNANQGNAAPILKDHIKNGLGRMPGGMATDSEAAHLAKMILNLANAK